LAIPCGAPPNKASMSRNDPKTDCPTGQRVSVRSSCGSVVRVHAPQPVPRQRIAALSLVWCEMRRLSWERGMYERKAKKDAPAAVVSRVACVSRAPLADVSRLALAGWDTCLVVNLLSTIRKMRLIFHGTSCTEGMVAQMPRKKGKRYLICTPGRPHEPILLFLVFNSV